MLDIQVIRYRVDSGALFEAIRDLPYCCWLDSGRPWRNDGRYDILTACPSERYVTWGKHTAIYRCSYPGPLAENGSAAGSERLIAESERDPFDLVATAVEALTGGELALPFVGGAIGYFGYDLAGYADPRAKATDGNHNHNYHSSRDHRSRCRFADMHMGIYKWAIIQDHQQRHSVVVSQPGCEPSLRALIERRLQAVIDNAKPVSSPQIVAQPLAIGPWQAMTSAESYTQLARKIDDYIRAGDCYQINLAQCFYAAYRGDPYAVYRPLRQAMASPFCAYLSLGDRRLLCWSPERFIKIAGRKVMTQPIKGTIPRHQNPSVDRRRREALRNSEKNRAENVMIVDLLRNDLGKTCIPGSIRVDELFALDSFANVHHLVSTITGTVDPAYSALDTLKACFPGGSITGAPKRRAMAIIEELEPCRRAAYCGSISYISANGHLDSNIVIRSVLCDGQQLYCWGGSGIVADSDSDDEYRESLTKIQRILDRLKQPL